MLAKIMKYELRASVRQLGPLFGLALAMCAVSRVMRIAAPLIWRPLAYVLERLAMALGGLPIAAVVIVAMVTIVVRFWNSMVGSEAYLTFTLPAKAGTQFWARLWVGMLSILASIVTAILCAFLSIPGFAKAFFESNAFSVIHVNGVEIPLRITARTEAMIYVILVAAILLAIFYALTMVYAAIAIGTQVRRGKMLGSVLGYFALSTVENIVLVPVLVFPLINMMGSNEDAITQWVDTNLSAALMQSNAQLFFDNVLMLLGVVLGALAVGVLILCAVHILVANRLFTKRLNLE